MSKTPPSPIVEHVGLTVTDLERAISFYTGVFGFSVLRRTTINAYLHHGEDLLELIQATDPRPRKQPTGAEEWRNEMFTDVGLNHLGFRVDDLDDTIAELERRGARLVVPPFEFTPIIEQVADVESDKLARAARPRRGASWRVAVFADPDGTMLELLER